MSVSPSPMMRPISRAFLRRAFAALTGVTLLAIACGEPTGPARNNRGTGTLAVSAVMNAVTATTLVLEIAAPDITPTLVYNLPVVNGVASGTVTIPAGADRQITARAFDGQTETHRGTRTQTIVAGANASVAILLIPLQGQLPITVTLGSLVVTVTPNTVSPRVGDTVQFAANVVDVNGQAASFPVAWASTDTRIAIVEPSGRAIMVGAGTAQIVATTNGAAGTAALTVSPAIGPAPPAYLKTWVGGFGAGTTRNNWAEPNNWAPAGVPTFTDSVVLVAATFQPTVPLDTFRVRDLVVRTGATLGMASRVLTVVGGVLAGEGGTISAVGGELRLLNGSRLRGSIGAPVVALTGTVTLAAPATVFSLTVRGTGTVFDVNGQTLTTTAPSGQVALNVTGGGVLQMDAALDTVDVSGNAFFQASAGAHAGALTAGALVLRADLSDGARLDASGTHTVIFAGSGAVRNQQVNGMDRVARPTNLMQQVVISGSANVTNCSPNWRVVGAFSIVAPDSLRTCTSYTLVVSGPFSSAAGSTVVPYALQLEDVTGTSNVAGFFAPTFTTLTAPTAAIRTGLNYEDLLLTASTTVPTVSVTGTLTITGSASTVVAIDNAANTAVQVGALLVQSGAQIAMAEATDSLVVLGTFNANAATDLSARLTAGTLRVAGPFFGAGFGATGTHRTVLDGANATATQNVNSMAVFSRAFNAFANLEIRNSGLGASICFSDIRVLGTLRVAAGSTLTTCAGNTVRLDGDVVTDAGSTVTSVANATFLLTNALGTSNVAGAWTPSITEFAAAGATIRGGLGYQSVRVTASTTLPAGLTLTGDLTADGATTVLAIPAGRTSVQDFTTNTGGRFTLETGDTVLVRGNTAFLGGASAPTGGVLEVRGNYSGAGYFPVGDHELRMTGSGTQLISSINDRVIPKLRVVSGTTSLNFINLVVGDSLVVAAGATFTMQAGNTITVRGALVTAAGSTFSPFAVNLEGTTTLQAVNGAFTPNIVRVVGPGTGAGTSLRNSPGIQYTNVEFYTSYALSDSLVVGGSIYASGAGVVLDWNGRKIRAPLGLNFDNNASGRMVNAADTLIVGNGDNATSSLLWDSGTSGTVSAGTIIVRGGSTTMSAFNATGTNRVIYTDTGFVLATRSSPINGGGTFRRLTIRGQAQYSALVNFATLNVTDSLRVETGTFQIVNGTAVVDGSGQGVLFMGPAAVLTAQGTGNVNLGSAVGTSLVAAGATFAPTTTRFLAANPIVNPSLAYQNVEFYGPVTFSGNTNIAGYLYAQNAGAGVALGGRRVNVGNYVDMGTSAFLVMNNAADTLDVVGDLAVDGGVPSTMTNGVVLFRGTTFTGTNYNAVSPHRTVFLGTTGAPQNVNGNTAFGRVEVGGARGFSANSSTYTVADSFVVSSAVPLTGGGTLDISGPFVASAPIAISTNLLRLRHPSGAGNLQPGTTFGAGTVALSSATTSTLRPNLTYNALALESDITLTGPVSAAGNVVLGNGVLPVLRLAGNTFSVAGQMDVISGGRLIMNNPADLLRMTGTAYLWIQATAGTGDLSSGTIEVSSDFYPYSTGHAMSGTHRVLMTRSDTRNQILQQSGSVPIANLEIGGTGARTITIQAAQDVLGTFTVSATAPVTVTQSAPLLLRVVGDMTAPASATINLPGTLQTEAATGISNLLGTVTLGQLNIGGAARNQTLPTAARYTIGNLAVLSGASTTVASGTRRIGSGTAGTITVNGTVTIPDGATLKACRSDNAGLAGGAPGLIAATGTGALELRLAGPRTATTFGAGATPGTFSGFTDGVNLLFGVATGC